MKNYRQLLKELPSKKVVFAFGRFQPPTIGHELLVKAVQKLASAQKADHVIYASKTEDKKQNPLPVSRKVYYLQRMFPGVNFRAADAQVRTFIEAAKELNKNYKNIVMVAGSDRVAEYKKILEKYNGTEFNFDTVSVVSAGERDPDSDTASGMSGTKMREAAKAGKFTEFKQGVPKTLTDLDARRLMNEIRKAYEMTPVKESLNIEVDELREKYFRGEIFNVGDSVICEDKSYIVVKRGSNHLLLSEQDTGIKVNRWIKDVRLCEGSDKLTSEDTETGKEEMQESLTNKTLKTTSADQLKAARIIATTLGADNVESMSNPTQIVNIGLRKIRNKGLNPESFKILQRMLKMASDIGIEYDTNLLPSKLKEAFFDKILSYDAEGNLTEIEIDSDGTIPNNIKRNITVGSVGHTLHNEPENTQLRKQKVRYHLGEANGDPKKLARDVAKAALAARHARDKESLATKHTAEKERIAEEEVDQIDEISSKLAGNYYGAATKKHIEKVGVKPNMYGRIEKDMGAKRKAGVDRAMDRITGARKTNEEAELEENHLMDYRRYTQAAKNAKSKGDHDIAKDAEQKASKAAANYSRVTGKKPTFNEEVEEAKDFSKYTIKPVKTEPKIVRKTNPAGRTTDHVEYEVHGTLSSHKKTFKSKKEAEEYFNTVKEELEETTDESYIQPAGTQAKKRNMIKIGSDGPGERRTIGKDVFSEESDEEHEISDAEIDSMVNAITDWEHIIDAYDDDELAIIDEETGEEIHSTLKEEVEELNEVLSRIERIKAKARFARTKSKRMIKTKVALKRSSPQSTINKRARRLAIKNLKLRIAKKPLNKLSVAEKERLEQRVSKMKPVLNRIAMRLAPKVRQVEKQRLSHSTYTK